MYYVLVALSSALVSVDFAFNNRYQKQEGTGLQSGLLFSALNGLLAAIAFAFLQGFHLSFSLYSAMFALLIALCGTSYMLLGFRIMKTGGMAVYALFLMTGGMLLPYLFGVIWLDEMFSAVRVVGLLLLVAAVVLMNRVENSISGRQILLCAAVFVINGLVSILSKLHQIGAAHAAVNSMTFVSYMGAAKFLICGVMLLLLRKSHGGFVFPGKSSLLLILCSALIGGGSYVLQLIGAANLPATVLYPLVTGGSIICSALFGLLFFGEKLSRRQIISVALCMAGTLFFL